MKIIMVLQPKKKGKTMALDSLASQLKMPMRAGGAQGGKKTVDEELDDQFGSKDGAKGKTKFDPKMPMGEASVEQLQAALDAKQKEEDSETGEEEAAEGDDGSTDDGSRDSEGAY